MVMCSTSVTYSSPIKGSYRMIEKDLQEIALQLSCPQGEAGVEIGNNMNELNQFMTSRTIEALSVNAGESILEIGPGNGLLSLPLLTKLGKTGHYLGIELSETMAREAKQALHHQDCSVSIFNGDYTKADIKAASIDGIMAVNVVYFIENLHHFLTQIFSWLTQNGRLVLGVRSDKTLNNLPFTQYGFHIRSPDVILAAMKQAGFTDTKATHYEEGMVPLGDMSIAVDSVIISGHKSM